MISDKINENELPKTIWFLWLQGLETAPLVVKKCYASWIEHNKDWKIVLLTADNIKDYVSLSIRQMTKQAFSDVLRINLLAKYGGVWVDATCFCVKPLDLWINEYTINGFFAFERPGPDRMISTWFIASKKNNYTTEIYKKAVNTYWTESPDMRFIEISKWHSLNKYLQRYSTKIWFSKFVSKVLKVHPYFWFHYLFEKIYHEDKKVKQMWDETPKISADIPHTLHFAGLFDPMSESIKAEIDNKTAPCYKLTWRYEPSAINNDTVIGYLLNAGQGHE